MPIRVEIKDEKGRSISVTNIAEGDSLSYPLASRKPFTEELLVIYPNGGFNHSTRRSLGNFKGVWSGVYDTVLPGRQTEFAVPPQSRLIIKNI